jgi:hypothetical protein
MPHRTPCSKIFHIARRVFFMAILLLLITPSTSMSAGHDTEYLNSLISDARLLKLSTQHYWDLLMHYRSVRDGRASTVDDPRFFLSKKGNTDPEAELEATLAGFFEEPVEGKEQVRCRFVARYTWLKEQLQIDESRLPAVACSDFERTLSAINPMSVVLIFPVAYLNSPASMFGHTLLRIDGGYESALVSLAVNYAAVTEESIGISYVLKGISGGYRGYYYSLPYYEKVREYTAIEHRDIWEYTLDLTEEEARRIVLHIWEMRGIHSAYYFFGKNCSYAVLYLLEIARPTLRMIETFEATHHLWVIPSETVRAVVDGGIVTRVEYRPSQGTRIRKIAAELAKEGRRLAYDVATGAVAPTAVAEAGMTEDDLTRTFDLASEYIRYLATRRMIGSEEYLSRFHGVLQERSKLNRTSEGLSDIPIPVRPDEGHLPGRIGIGGGCRTGSCFGEISLRPAYHDLLDNDDGYVEGAQIDFMKVNLRYDLNDRRAELHSLQILDIESLAPRDLFFRPLSWKVNVGVEQKVVPGGKERLVTALAIGAGASVLIGPAITYALPEVELNASRSFEDGATFGAGGSAGVLAPLTHWWKIHCWVRGITPLLGAPYRTIKGEVAQNFMIDKNSSMSAIVSREMMSGCNRSEAKMLWNIYF